MISVLFASLVFAPPTEFRFRAGDLHTYELRTIYLNAVDDETTEWVERVEYLVKSVTPGRLATLEVRRLPLKYIVDGQSIALRPKPTTTIRTEERNPVGQVRNRMATPHDPFLHARQGRILDFRYPGKPLVKGLTWVTRMPSLDRNLVPEAVWEWQVNQVSAESVGLEFTFREMKTETAMKGKGTMLIDPKTGWPSAARASIENAKIPGDELARSVTLRLSLTKTATKLAG